MIQCVIALLHIFPQKADLELPHVTSCFFRYACITAGVLEVRT